MRVLKRIVSPMIEEIVAVVPEVSIYKNVGTDDWEMLQITGPLFVLRIEGNPDPYIYILNNTCWENTENFSMKIVVQNTEMKTSANRLYLKFADGSMRVIATEKASNIEQLFSALSNFSLVKEEKKKVAPLTAKDATFQHLLKFSKL